ncbi:calmodulin-binding transcription activator 5-like isoform X1 [Pistacia vera]|uniref:calmodulin-binding transcription activator 5-like isoform X1 n=1 Tax=Pistacia vera TaxID=55513 RepID=UPI0012637061|nr:calmodulin-binding transcription activator 5-like isoform X1 [Pistacia vera]
MGERLVGSEIHGFHTLRDLDVGTMMEEAKTRWLRPNEIHAILCNSKHFSINAKPVNLPKSGTVVLFDRKMLRNFRKDGHNWKKKKDGKTVKEAHEHLKVGNEERIHVYYAHGEDSPTFVRRCYWLLDKSLENIVLVHYRETQEGSPATPPNSHSSSVSDQSAPWRLPEEFDSGAGRAYYAGEKELAEQNDNLTVQNHELRLLEINTLEWDDLVVANDSNNSTVTSGGNMLGKVSYLGQQNHSAISGGVSNGGSVPAHDLFAEVSSVGNLTQPITRSDNAHFNILEGVYGQTMGSQVNLDIERKDFTVCTSDTLDILASHGLQSQDSFGKWMNHIITDSPGSVDDPLQSSILSGDQQYTVYDHIFNITDVAPAWAFSTEKTKILITGFFHEEYLHLAKSNLLCVCGDVCLPADVVQVGVYRCLVSPHSPGLVNLYMSIDGHKPISQILNFEYRAPLVHEPVVLSEDKAKWEEFQLQTRLACLLFSTSKGPNILSGKVSPNALTEAKKFILKTSHICNSWAYLNKLIGKNTTSVPEVKDSLFELTLKNKLKEWLVEKIVEGCKATEYDSQGQGVIHLCAILGYTWAIHLFSWSGLSLDFRDKYGWTALHWAAYCGREQMVATLLSVGAKPNLVTDPTSENPGGCTVADLASKRGYEGLAAYVSEKALVAQFNDMTIAGNISGTLPTGTTEVVNTQNLTEDELNLKDTLTAYRNAASAAARIQAAFREHSLKVQTKAIQFSNPEDEAQSIIAAMKIQHAYRNFDTRKKMAAAVHIQHRFRSWKIRKDFLNKRRQAIKIQAAFRGFQVRKQYRKILWSVGVLEKAILRWRLKRKGFRGFQVDPGAEAVEDQKQDSDVEEDFYRASRKQAEERVERSVVRVQAMFRSKKAQEDYRRMKMAHDQARLEYEGLLHPEVEMDT